MRERIILALPSSNSLDETAINLISLLADVSLDDPQIGYVAGIVTSDGTDKIDYHIKRLEKFTEEVRKKVSFPVFSSTEVFGDTKLWQKFEHEPYQSWLDFWKKVLGSGHVTDLFLTPGWERSIGAKDEYETAKTRRLQIHLVTEDFSIEDY